MEAKGRKAWRRNMMDGWKSYLWVALGSAVGGMSRFWVSGFFANRWGGAFPWGTVIVNISGSFVIGILAALSDPNGRMPSETRVFWVNFLMIGICGGYTTFSSFSLQTLNLFREGQWLYAGGNVMVSVVCCLLAVALGFLLGQISTRIL